MTPAERKAMQNKAKAGRKAKKAQKAAEAKAADAKKAAEASACADDPPASSTTSATIVKPILGMVKSPLAQNAYLKLIAMKSRSLIRLYRPAPAKSV